MDFKWSVAKDFVMGWLYLLDGIRLILLPGIKTHHLWLGKSLSMAWVIWITRKWVHSKSHERWRAKHIK
jgi:hypothetical protein